MMKHKITSYEPNGIKRHYKSDILMVPCKLWTTRLSLIHFRKPQIHPEVGFIAIPNMPRQVGAIRTVRYKREHISTSFIYTLI